MKVNARRMVAPRTVLPRTVCTRPVFPRTVSIRTIAVLGVLYLFISWAAVQAAAQSVEQEKEAVAQQLDQLHRMASKADYNGYFSLYHDTAVFHGTDATERWPIDEFRGYTKARFEQGTGWTYVMQSRNIFIAKDGQTAWFDELLENTNLGLTRGTGVLVKENGRWLFTQYNLTIPVPNDLARDLVARIRQQTEDQ